MTETKNYIEVNIGGRIRKVKYSFMQYRKVFDLMLSDSDFINNPYDRLLKCLSIGLDLKENDLPPDFGEELIADWIDAMEQEECDLMTEFTEQALGFILRDANERVESRDRIWSKVGLTKE